MKSTSKKSTGLLGGFDFQPVFSEQILSRSEPKEEEASQTKPNKYINREARRHGMTIGQFVYALAVAAAEGKIELEDFLED